LGLFAYRQHHRYKHVATHEPGMVYRSAWVEPDVMSELIEKHQIRAVVNLCNPGEMGEKRWIDEREAVTNAGARLIELPMPLTVEADDPSIDKHLQVLSDPNNYPMLIHCQHGVTRTAKLLTIYDVAFRKMSAAESLAAQPLFGRDDHNVNVRAFCKNFEKEYTKLYPTAKAESLDVLRK
jgi:protein tyrosine/serine phosphatase